MRGMIKVEELRSAALKTRDEKRHIPQLLAVLGEEDKAEQGFYYGTFMLKKEFFFRMIKNCNKGRSLDNDPPILMIERLESGTKEKGACAFRWRNIHSI